MEVRWVDGFKIDVKVEDGTVVISANREGLLSLARQMEDLAEMCPGTHIHYDEYNSLEDGSNEIIIALTE
ncbi:MAG: hypothetical protein J5744_04525 [Oscillospiraceae bacterium]|nr:hypothetical protein [Oscillospiraceae bacterium]